MEAVYPPAESEPGGVALSVRRLGCRASGIHDMSFEVRAGEIFGLAGLLGAGRTELARVLFGITPRDEGEIALGGKAVSIGSPRAAVGHGIAYVPEDRRRHGVITEMSVAANTTMAIHPRIFPLAWLRPRVERRVADRYIGELGTKTPSAATAVGALSGGNQQKVALARWLATEPKVLILDEPTQGVDVGAKAEIHKIVRGLAARGLAVIMISSDLPEILGMSDRIGVMHGGTLVAVLAEPERRCACGHGGGAGARRAQTHEPVFP